MKNNKIKILFDANPIATNQKTGIGIYSENLLKSISEAGGENIQIIAFYYNFLNRKKGIEMPKANNVKYRKVILYPGALINLLRRLGINMPVEFMSKTKCDVGIYPNYLSYNSLFEMKRVTIVHDLTHELFPQFMSEKNLNDLRKFLPAMIKKSDLLVTISNSTKKDIIEKYKYKKEILVTPIPLSLNDISTTDIISVRKKYSINKKFILFVGTLEPRKNLINLMDAFEINEELKKNYSLVICGKLDWKYEDTINKYNELKNKGISIVVTGYVDDKTKNTLYKNCATFVLPSYYEGFGMPLVEANYFNAKLAVSDIPVFHEVAGNNAAYFNPNDPLDISKKLLLSIKNSTVKSKLPYSEVKWSDNANVLLSEIYKLLK
jgi:glycosyltransferase involved in cell wall biosynthesis